MIENLPKQLQTVYDLMATGNAIPFATIHDALFTNGEDYDPRLLQQRIGPYIGRLNRRIAKFHMQVKPGVLKGTYVLQRTH